MIVQVKLTTGRMPTRAYANDAGWDVHSAEDAIIGPGQMVRVSCGLSLAVPVGWVCDVRPRSGLAFKNRVTVLNAPGTIDAGYRGDVSVMLVNHHPSQSFMVSKADRIAQLVFHRLPPVELTQVDVLPESADGRGEGGHGSTGK